MRAGREIKQTNVRLPEGLRKWLKEKAEENGRSFNSEVVQRLLCSQRTEGAEASK